MTATTTVTQEALSASLEQGDLMVNLTAQDVPCSVAFVCVSSEGRPSVSTGFMAPAIAEVCADSLRSLLQDVRRVVIVSDGGDAGLRLADELQNASVENSHFLLATDCEADSFMDAEDSEAVAERLRQLGYI